MMKKSNVMLCCKHIAAILLVCVCTFMLNLIEFQMMRTHSKWQFVMMELASGLQILGCAAFGFWFGKKETIRPKNIFHRMDIIRIILIPVFLSYSINSNISCRILNFIFGAMNIPDAPVIQQFAVVKLFGLVAVASFAVFEVVYLLAKHTGKEPAMAKVTTTRK